MSIEYEKPNVEFSSYEQLVEQDISGPQLKGLVRDSYERARNDERSVFLDILADGKQVKWPMAVPLEYHQDYNPDYMSGTKNLFQFSLPPVFCLDDNLESIINGLNQFKGTNSTLVFECQGDTEDKSYYDAVFESADISAVNATSDVVAFGKKTSEPAVNHFKNQVILNREPGFIGKLRDRFAGRGDSKKDEPLLDLEAVVHREATSNPPEQGVALLSSEYLNDDKSEETLEKIWNIYDKQFTALAKNHPSLQKQPREELMKMLKSSNSVVYTCFDNSEPVAMCYFQHGTSDCEWLNQAYYEDMKSELDDGVDLVYFPGIVVAKEYTGKGRNYVQSIISHLGSMYVDSNKKGLCITYQCTETSSTYIPRYVSLLLAMLPGVDVVKPEGGNTFRYGSAEEIASYRYHTYKVN